MAEYKSAYTGPQIDAAIGAVAGKQDTLVSGTNIKTINNNSILGSGNLVISGGGGGGEIYELDATDATKWDPSTQKPTDAVIAEIANGNYQMIHIFNILVEEILEYQVWLVASTSVDYDENNTHMRQFYKMDAGDDEEGEPPFIEIYTLLQQPMEDSEDPTELEYIFAVDEVVIPSGEGGRDIYFETVNNPISETKVALDLEAISAAIDEGKEVIIKVNAYGNYPSNRYFHMNSTLSSQQWFEDVQKLLWSPQFACKTVDHEFSMSFDEFYNGEFVFEISEGGKKFQPTSIDMSNNIISFDIDDATYIFNVMPDEMTVNIDENSGDLWIKFNKSFYDGTQGSETVYYVSDPVPVLDSGAITFQVVTIIVGMDNGNLTSSIYTTNLSEGTSA